MTGLARRGLLSAAPLGVLATVLPAASAHASEEGVTGTGAAGALTVRPFLSEAGRAAHDAVAAGDLFGVTPEDYAAVVTGLAAAYVVAAVGMDAELMGGRGGNWSATTASRVAGAVWPAGAFLLGGRVGVRTDLSPLTVTILVGADATAGHVPVGAGATRTLPTLSLGPDELFVLRRDPVAAAVDRSLACVGASGATSDFVAYSSTSTTVDGAWTSWSAGFGRVARQQYLIASPR